MTKISMGNRRRVIITLAVTVLFISAIIGTAFYNEIVQSNNKLNLLDKDTQASGKVTNTTTPTPQIENLIPKNIDVSTLTVREYPKNPSGEFYPGDWLFNSLGISGAVSNNGNNVAENVGLHIIADSSNRTRLIDMIIPVTQDYYVVRYGANGEVNRIINAPDIGKLSTMPGQHMVSVNIIIYHQRSATNWTVTPVWTNSPSAP